MSVEITPENLLLYKKTLINAPVEHISVKAEERMDILIVSLQKATLEDELELLTKILKASNLGTDQYNHIVINGQDELLPTIHAHKPKKIILFGLEPSPNIVQLKSKLYTPFIFNGYQILISQSLRLLKNEATGKKKLWEALKTMLEL